MVGLFLVVFSVVVCVLVVVGFAVVSETVAVGSFFSVVEDVVSDQGRLFYFLNPRYNLIVTILVTATSFGLIGFILYGKGG